MDIKMFIASLLAVFGLIAPLQAGNGHHNNGGNVFSGRSSAGRSQSFSSMPARSFGSNRAMYSGQRFSSFGTRSSVARFHPQSVNHFGAQQFGRGNFQANRFNHLPNNARIGRTGNGFASSNRAIANQRTGQFASGKQRLASNWRNHVFAQRAGNWHPNWNRNADHWWHGHRCHFFNGSWVIFDIGFSPWWWDYPYYSYGYGYPYDYGYNYGYGYGSTYDYGYNNDPGVYDSQPVYQNGDDQSGYQNGPDDQSSYRSRSNAPSANSTVAGAQDRLT
jgi:hypothetical protein